MNELIKVSSKDVLVIEWKGQRVLTTAQIADVYEASEQQILQNFNNNKENFEEGKHFYHLKGEELKSFKSLFDNFEEAIGVSRFTPQLYLWTHKGANRHCKPLGTNKAWDQFEILEDTYFNPTTSIDNILEDPDFGIQLLTAYKEEKEKSKKLVADNIRMKPKEIFADAVSVSANTILIGELAKMIKQNGIDIGQNRLFDWMRNNEFLVKRKGADYNMPTQKSMELELFEIKEGTVINPDGSTRTTRTPKVTGKGQQYFINKFLDSDEFCRK